MDYPSILNAVLELARRYHYEKPHSHQVARLALMLFDQLRECHGLDDWDRVLLESGALLHDIGWFQGQKGHHKTSMQYILDADLPFKSHDTMLVALIARYHRKGLPQDDHEGYQSLLAPDRRRVSILGGMVRLADGLDRSHGNLIAGLHCRVEPGAIRLLCQCLADPHEEFLIARQKCDLLAAALEHSIQFESILI